MIEKEYEIKLLLYRSEYEFLSHLFRCHWDAVTSQTNYYYDTDTQSMRKQNVTVRIRETDESIVGIVKTHLGTENCSLEEHFATKSVPANLVWKGTALFLKGSLKTDRCRLALSDTLTLMLDRNCYLDTEDYELELEYDEHSSEKAIGIMLLIGKLLNTPKKVSSLSKSERFFQRLNTIGEKCNA